MIGRWKQSLFPACASLFRKDRAPRWIEDLRLSDSEVIGFDQPIAGDSVSLCGDLVVLLDQLEKMSLQDFSLLLAKVESKRVLISYSETRYRFEDISLLLDECGFHKRELRSRHWFGNGRVILAERLL